MQSTTGTAFSALKAVSLGLEVAFISQSEGSVLGGLFSDWLKNATSSTHTQLKQPAAAAVREKVLPALPGTITNRRMQYLLGLDESGFF